ncbi:MAG: TonB-dependent receptor [Ignavibacteria bacterium]|nr:TonB-dependent receptor [Ignavibacteria bacterium]
MKIKTLLPFIVLLFLPILTFSQNEGVLSGIVIDKVTQSPLKDINIRISGTVFSDKSREDGSFRIEGITPGIYSVEFSSVNYQKYVEQDVVISGSSGRELIVELIPITTEEVVVEDARFRKPSEVSTSFKSLRFEEIRRFPGGLEDIGRVIQSLPGVALTSDGRNDLLVRGGSPAENLFIVDGFEVNNFNHFGAQGSTGGPTSILNLDFASEINFYTGGFSVKYGDKLSSVVEVKQRNGNRERFYGKVNISGTGVGANFEGPIKKGRSSWLISVRRSYLDLIFNASGFSFVPEYTDFQLKTVYPFGRKNSIEFSSFGALDKVRFNNDTEENRQNNERILTNNQKSYASGIIWKHIASKNSLIKFTLSRNYVNYFFSKRDSLFNETFRNSSKESDTQLKSEFSLKTTGNLFINLGIGSKIILLDYNIDKKADTLLVSNTNSIVIPPVFIDLRDRTYKAFGYGEITANFNRFKITAGIRTDYFEYTKKLSLSPRVNLTYTVSPKLNINSAAGIFHQTPSYIWLVATEDNRNLDYIRAEHFIGGIEYFFDESTRLTVEGYYKRYRNYPVSRNRPYLILANNSGFENQNSFGLESLVSSGTGKAYGLEIFLQRTLSKNFYGAMSISLSDVKYKALDGVERRSDWDNRFVINLNAGYKIGSKWEFSTKFRLAGGRPYTPINPSNGAVDYNQYNSKNYPVYHRLDLRAERRWFFRNWVLTAYIDIQNIYNRKNIFEYRWNKFKKEIETSKNLGILPTIGISAEF